ncbi:MAG: hypothetical protein COA78_05735 [Blastopirellula sp.]|nr:MAG: hypothetical protein COA78_05735 [Blastopirellula sp.]
MTVARTAYLENLRRNPSGGIKGSIMIGGKLMHCPDGKQLVEKSKQLVSKNVDDGTASQNMVRVSDEDGKFRGFYDLESANKLIAQCNAMTEVQKSAAEESEADENAIFNNLFGML